MADATATFALVLDDEVSGAAKSAAAALADLKTKIDQDTKSLSGMRRAMRQMKAAGLTGSATFKSLESRADALKVSIGQSQKKFVGLGGTFGAVTPKAEKAAGAFDTLAKGAGAAGGPVGGLVGSLGRLGPLLANPAALVIALAAGFVALSVAVVAATVALSRFAIVSSGARRDEALQIEGLNTLRHQWGRTTASVEEFQAAIDRADDSTNVGRGTLQRYARSLSRAGLRGEALTEAVEAMGIAAQVQGDRGAARFRALAINAQLAGGDVRALSEDYRNRLGPIARRQMLSIGNQTDRLRRSLDRIFSGIRLEPFLSSLDEMLSLFSQSTFTGRALKSIVETLLQPLIDSMAVVGPIARRFFQGFVIGALITVIWIQRVSRALGGLFGDEFVSNVNLTRAALWLGVGAFVAMVFAVGVLTGLFVLWAAAILIVAGAFLILPALVIGFGLAVGFAVGAIVRWFRDTDFGALARNMIDGLVNGLRNGAARVARGARRLATGARDAFTSALGIGSPSTVFAEFGLNVAQGAAHGIEAGTPAVEDATSSLVDAPAGGGVGGATSLSFGDINITAGDSSDPRELALQLRDELASILEGVGIEMAVST